MRFADYAKKLLAIAETLNGWVASAAALDHTRREKIARFSLQIAETLARAAAALDRLESDPKNPQALAAGVREFGRISGYIETIVDVMRHHLDGRKLAGVKRRLEQLEDPSRDALGGAQALRLQIDRLTAAEGYFRALADGLSA
jgi:hypothetical protein